ncbi:hypothetical protein Glove_227g15 [Diversispora epigaea]|uniref:BTB domain-containing protein n=1 Tax=Diversispora epigaea TaxID=1348612 RepID=A0A397IMZ6_9GLOM|nr:hypothetical protein Glove_227g15 [Diversispora epigaea]
MSISVHYFKKFFIKKMTSNFHADLASDLGLLFKNGQNYDVMIHAGEEPNVKEFPTHSLILCSRSPYFQTALSSDRARKKGGVTIFKKPNISANIFNIILQYLYTASIDLGYMSGVEVLKLWVASDELDLQKLITFIQSYMADKKIDYLQNDPVQFIQTTFRYETCKSLRDFCIDSICAEPKILLNCAESINIEESLLLLLLERDDLLIDEIEIWQYLLKWGISQSSSLISLDINNVYEWSVEDFTMLRKILHPFIPLIRWFQIPAVDFWRKVRPFEQILQKELYFNIVGHHLDPAFRHNSKILPPRSQIFDSIIIDQKHFKIIVNWIAEKNIGPRYEKDNKENKPSYSFHCLLRASRDGFDARTFHKLCDDQGPTIVVSKIKETGQIIGGYNPLNWQEGAYNYDTWLETKQSFLFSFENKLNLDSAIIARVTDPEYAIGYSPQRGPSFGDGWDLTIETDCSLYSHSNNSYNDITKFIANTTRLNLEDYEVFQLIHRN